jgi:CHAT domain-containing protein
MEQYTDFDLHINPNGHIVASSYEGERYTDISIQIPNEIQLTLELLKANQTNEAILIELGKRLYNHIFPGPIHTHFHQTEAVARNNQEKIRLRLTIEPDILASLPWEFMYREEGGYFFGNNPNTVLSRYLNLPLPQNKVRKHSDPLHMLIITAEPNDKTPFNPNKDKWIEMITNALDTPIKDGKLIVKAVKEATRQEIRNALLDQKPDIVQFIGHGIYRDGKGQLALVNDAGKTWLVDDNQFADMFSVAFDHLGLVSLATCESAKSDSPQGFLGIAPKIVQRGVPAVVAMQYGVLMASANVFLEDFYKAVAARKPVDWAVQSARNQVSLAHGLNNREFATPVLYMRAKDGIVF